MEDATDTKINTKEGRYRFVKKLKKGIISRYLQTLPGEGGGGRNKPSERRKTKRGGFRRQGTGGIWGVVLRILGGGLRESSERKGLF